jgi:hypothetical protein
MAAVNDFADVAAAITAGWKQLQIDRGAGKTERYQTLLEKPVTGAGQGGSLFSALGTSDVSAAAADTAALASLNAQRRHRYSGAPGRASGSSDSPDARGVSHTVNST